MGDELTQYQKDLIRMWDSMREDCKGSEYCDYVSCSECPLYSEVCFDGNEISGLTSMFDAEKVVKIVTQWAKDHPIKSKEVSKMSDNQWFVDVADVDEENCVIRIWNMHCPECGYDPLADTASSITIPGPERTENGTYFINGLNVPKTCPKCGKVLSADNDEKKKKTFLVEMDSTPVMGINGGSCECPACLSGPHPMCLIAGAQVQNLDHCPVLKEVTDG